MARSLGPLQYQGNSLGAIQYDPRDIGHVGAHQDQRNVGALMNLPPSVKPGLPRLNTAHELATGLIGAWPMAQLSGTTVEDLSGNGNDGELAHAYSFGTYSWVHDPKIGAALSLEPDGSNLWAVDVGTYSNSGGHLTLAAWVKASSAGASDDQILTADSNTDNNRAFQFRISTAGTVQFIPFVGGTPLTTLAGTTNIRDDAWHFVVAVADGTNASVYVDGRLEGTVAAGAVDDDPAYMVIGGRRNTAGADAITDGWDGDIADARIWNRALSAAEISRMYADPWSLYEVTAKPEYPVLDTSNPLSDSLVVALPLSEGGGTTVADVSGHGNHGTATAASWATDTEHGPYFENGASGTDYIELPAGSAEATNGLTFHFRVKATGTPASNYILAQSSDAVGDHIRILSTGATGDTRIEVSDGWSFATVASGGLALDGSWHSFTVTVDSSYVTSYLDGVQQAQVASTGVPTITGAVRVLANMSGTANLEAQLADVRVFDKALAASDVADLAEDPWLLYLDGAERKPAAPVLDTSHELASGLIHAYPVLSLVDAELQDIAGTLDLGVGLGSAGTPSKIYDRDFGLVADLGGQNAYGVNGLSASEPVVTNDEGTFAVWFRLSSIGTTDALVSTWNDVTGTRLWLGFWSGGQLRWQGRETGGTTQAAESSNTYVDGNWHLAVGTYKTGETLKLYADGVLLVESGSALTDLRDGESLEVGCWNDGGTSNTPYGQIGDVRIWDRALSAAEIQRMAEDPWALYQGTESAPTNITGTGDATLPSFTTAGTGSVTSTTISGTAAATLPSFTTAGTGGQKHTGTGAATLPGVTAAGTGAQKHTGTAAVTLPGFTASGAGGIPSNVTGTGAATLPSFTTAGAGGQKHTGTGAATLPSFATSGVGGLVYQTKPVRPIVDTGHGLASGLVGAWAFTEGSGTEITDLSGNGNSGTASASSWGSDSEIGPYWKNSSTGTPYVTIPAAAFSGITTAITISAHMKHDGTGAVAWSRVLGFDASSETLLALRDSTNTRAYGAINTGTGVVSTSPRAGTAYDGNWHNIALVWNGSTLSFYQDGVLQGSVAASGTLSISGDFGIGRSTEASAAYDPGLQIGDCRVWDRALSLSEIQSLTSDPWALYEGSASDITGTGNINLPQPSVAATGNLISDASAVLPTFSAAGTGKLKTVGNGAAVLPMFNLSGQGHRVLTGALPITGTPPTLWNTAERNTEIEGGLELGIDKGSWEFQVGVTIDGTLHMTGNDASLQWRFFNITRFPSMKARVYNRLLSLIEEGEFYPVAYEQDRLFTVDLTRRVSPAQIVIQELSAGFGMSHEHFSLKYERRRWWWEIRVAFQEEVTLEFFEKQLADDPPHLPRDHNYNIPPVWLRMDRSDYVHPARSESPTGTHVTFRFEAQLTPIS